MKFNLPEI